MLVRLGGSGRNVCKVLGCRLDYAYHEKKLLRKVFAHESKINSFALSEHGTNTLQLGTYECGEAGRPRSPQASNSKPKSFKTIHLKSGNVAMAIAMAQFEQFHSLCPPSFGQRIEACRGFFSKIAQLTNRIVERVPAHTT